MNFKRVGTQKGHYQFEVFFLLLTLLSLIMLFGMGVKYGQRVTGVSLSRVFFGLCAAAAPLGIIGILSLVGAAIPRVRHDNTFREAFEIFLRIGVLQWGVLFWMAYFVYSIFKFVRYALS